MLGYDYFCAHVVFGVPLEHCRYRGIVDAHNVHNFAPYICMWTPISELCCRASVESETLGTVELVRETPGCEERDPGDYSCIVELFLLLVSVKFSTQPVVVRRDSDLKSSLAQHRSPS